MAQGLSPAGQTALGEGGTTVSPGTPAVSGFGQLERQVGSLGPGVTGVLASSLGGGGGGSSGVPAAVPTGNVGAGSAATTGLTPGLANAPGFAALNLNPQEQNLLGTQVGTTTPPAVSAQQIGGQFYNLPLENFPAYPSAEAANSRWRQLSDWLTQNFRGGGSQI